MANDRMTPRLFLANELRRARETKGMTPAELARAVVVSESLVRAWDKGRRVPNPADLARFEEVCGTGGVLGRMREDLVQNEPAPEWMGRWLEIERQASSLLTYQPLLIPGLLQTPAYAREVIVSAGRQIDDVEAQVQARMDRQKILAEENSLMFVAIVDEGVLHRPIGGSETMREQLAHLLTMAEQSNVMIQVVPSEVGSYPGLAGGFVIAAMDGQEYAYVDDVFSGDVLEYTDDVAVMKRIWESLRVEALSGRQSIEMIKRAAEKWT